MPKTETATVLNREAWLTEVAKHAEEVFKGFKIAPYRVTCGFPSHSALSLKRRTVGQCFGIESSSGKVHELFISPVLDQPLEVAGTLVHELAHVVAGVKARHGKDFCKICRYIGLTKGKPTTAMPGEALHFKLAVIVEKTGAYPHQAIVPVMKLKKPSSSVGLICECGCRVTISTKWLSEAGLPTCGCGKEMNLKDSFASLEG